MISEEEVRRIAALAKLELKAEELARMKRDLGRILDLVDQIREIDRGDARGAPFPVADESGTVNREPANGARCAPLREDEPRRSLDHAGVAANAPRFLAAQFVVPRVLGGDS